MICDASCTSRRQRVGENYLILPVQVCAPTNQKRPGYLGYHLSRYDYLIVFCLTIL